jgi:hypothetical protein
MKVAGCGGGGGRDSGEGGFWIGGRDGDGSLILASGNRGGGAWEEGMCESSCRCGRETEEIEK